MQQFPNIHAGLKCRIITHVVAVALSFVFGKSAKVNGKVIEKWSELCFELNRLMFNNCQKEMDALDKSGSLDSTELTCKTLAGLSVVTGASD